MSLISGFPHLRSRAEIVDTIQAKGSAAANIKIIQVEEETQKSLLDIVG